MTARTRYCWRLFLACLALSVSASVTFGQAGPPFISDDPGTPGDGKWEVNVAYTYLHRKQRTESSVPLLDVNYGLGDRQQLNYELPWLFVSDDDGCRNSLGNSRVGWKYRFLDEDKNGLAMSMYPQAEFNNPTSSARRDIVDRDTQLFFPFEMARKVGPLELDAEAGYNIVLPGKDQWEYGFVTGYPVSDRLELGAEIRGTATQSFSSNELVFNLGGRWKFNDLLTLMASVGRTLRCSPGDTPRLITYIGVKFTF